MAEFPNVRLSLSNAPESIPIVRQALAGLAACLGLDALESNDLDTAVTETCNNVVYHAYEGQQGPLELEAYLPGGALEVVVRDRGIGIRPHVGERSQPHNGLGMPIVHALTERLVFSKLEGGGTEVRMRFATPRAAALTALPPGERDAHELGEDESARTIALSLAPSSLARAVLPRVLGALAQRVGCEGARIAAAQRLGEVLAANTCSDRAAPLHAFAALTTDALELRVGPLREGTRASLIDAPDAALVPGIALDACVPGVVPAGGAEKLTLRLVASA
jgi:anti-sigma regulatory factor (Ser/Thr protein kinase)